MKAKKQKKKSVYAYPLKLDEDLKSPLQLIASDNRRKINDEINIAVTEYLIKNKYAI